MGLSFAGCFPAWIADLCEALTARGPALLFSTSSAMPFSYSFLINYSTSLMNERLREGLDSC